MSKQIEKRVNHTYLCLWLVILFSSMSSSSFGGGFCWDLALDVNPPVPNSTAPITVTVSGICNDTCVQVCDVIGEWISPTEFHIDWYFRDVRSCSACFGDVTPHSSDVNLGVLDAGDYTVSSSLYIIHSCDAPCLDGKLSEETELPFEIGPAIPTVSQWGLCVMALLLMTTGTILANGGV